MASTGVTCSTSTGRTANNVLRKAIRPLVTQYVAVSSELRDWLTRVVGVDPGRVTRICNGVDAERFRPRAQMRPALGPEGFAGEGAFIVGTVGRMAAVKDQTTLVRAFINCVERNPVAPRPAGLDR
jgi:glycosyltransferase involved in cell wall biosynthesis